MKRIFAAVLTVIALSISNAAVATTPGSSSQTPEKLPSSIVDGIEVPFEVLDYAQMKYQGHAVTRAEKIFWNGRQVYRLWVDNSDVADGDSRMLLYDMNWRLLGDDKVAAPPQPTYTNYESQQGRPSRPVKPEGRENQGPREEEDRPTEDIEEEEDEEDDEYEIPRGRRPRD
jgi:hypothetical protein